MIRPVLLLSIALISACVSGSNTAYVFLGNVTISAEVADSPDERQLGLMNRESLAENGGMLFVFPEEAEHSFWMKNTKIPLDIVFISADLAVVDVQTMEPCYSDPCRTYPSKGQAKYVLEVNKGVAEKNGIVTGSKITVGWPQ